MNLHLSSFASFPNRLAKELLDIGLLCPTKQKVKISQKFNQGIKSIKLNIVTKSLTHVELRQHRTRIQRIGNFLNCSGCDRTSFNIQTIKTCVGRPRENN